MPYTFYAVGFTPLNLTLLLAAAALALYAQWKVRSTFDKYLRVPARHPATGAQLARELLDRSGLRHVPVEMTGRQLGDHYDPRRRAVRLSPEVYNGRSIAALSVAAHETGHAVQHAKAYVPLNIRSALFPLASIGTSMAFPLLFLGLIAQATPFVELAVWMFAAAVAFQVVTLPVEFDASARAMRMLGQGGYLSREELPGARSVLSAAALTYVAAAAMAIVQLLRLIVVARGMDRQ